MIWHLNHVPKQLTGTIQALCLQLVAKGIFALDILDKFKVGTDKLVSFDVVVMSQVGTANNGVAMEAHSIEEYWKGLNCIKNMIQTDN